MTQNKSQALLLEFLFILVARAFLSVDVLNIQSIDDIVDGCGGLQDRRWDGGKG